MPLRFKFDVLQALKEKGYSSARIRKEALLSESTVQKLRHRKPISWANIEKICALLELQPGDLIEYFDSVCE